MSWTAPSLIDELVSRMEAFEGLSGVRVWGAPVPPNLLDAVENVVFVRAPGDQAWAGLGTQSKTDAYTLEGSVLVFRRGTADEKATEARGRVGEIVAEIENFLRALVTDLSSVATAIGAHQITNLGLAAVSLEAQGVTDGSRWCRADFDISVSARI